MQHALPPYKPPSLRTSHPPSIQAIIPPYKLPSLRTTHPLSIQPTLPPTTHPPSTQPTLPPYKPSILPYNPTINPTNIPDTNNAENPRTTRHSQHNTKHDTTPSAAVLFTCSVALSSFQCYSEQTNKWIVHTSFSPWAAATPAELANYRLPLLGVSLIITIQQVQMMGTGGHTSLWQCFSRTIDYGPWGRHSCKTNTAISHTYMYDDSALPSANVVIVKTQAAAADEKINRVDLLTTDTFWGPVSGSRHCFAQFPWLTASHKIKCVCLSGGTQNLLVLSTCCVSMWGEIGRFHLENGKPLDNSKNWWSKIEAYFKIWCFEKGCHLDSHFVLFLISAFVNACFISFALPAREIKPHNDIWEYEVCISAQ